MAMRLQTDGNVPALSAYSSLLLFDHGSLFFDAPTGALGSLPLTMAGCLDVEREKDLVGDVHPVVVDAPRHVRGAQVHNCGDNGKRAGPHERAPRSAGRGGVDRGSGHG